LDLSKLDDDFFDFKEDDDDFFELSDEELEKIEKE
jgi:hypothetical protein